MIMITEAWMKASMDCRARIEKSNRSFVSEDGWAFFTRFCSIYKTDLDRNNKLVITPRVN